MTADELIEVINRAISGISARAALDLLDEIGSHIDAQIQALEEENNEE